MKSLIAITFSVLLIRACATSYQQSGFSGGYSETQLDENVFTVSLEETAIRVERVSDFSCCAVLS